jgi:hypothetical protein
MNTESMNKAASNRQQATARQATNKKGEWVKGTSISLYLVPCSLYLLKRFSQIRKKSAVIFLNLRHRSSLRGTKQSSVSSWIASYLAMMNNCIRKDGQAYCYHNNHLNQINHSSDIRKKSAVIFLNLCHRSSLRGTKQSSVSYSWIASYLAMTNNCIRKDGQAYCYHNNHSNQINHSSDKRKTQAKTRLLVHLSTCSLNRN